MAACDNGVNQGQTVHAFTCVNEDVDVAHGLRARRVRDIILLP